ncbi:MAG: bifunctional glutamate N-acetyltransferase/amino-acid acetyltransferase ArgJ, partial [Mycobacteriales bacterium]
GVFTSNKVKAAPVVLSQQVVAGGSARAVVLNSGGANACTGKPGYADAVAAAEQVAKSLGCEPGHVAVASTGLIGTRLPMDRLLPGITTAASQLSASKGPEAAQAIMTTDTVSKQATVTLSSGVVIGGMAKGAGMMAPALATMLVVVTTDADVSSADLAAALVPATTRTFDRVDIDGCMSTNDTVLLMASGASGVPIAVGSDDWAEFAAGVADVCADLAKQLACDAEGASKLITITVTGAASEADAVDVARSIARSALLKCAIHGEDANWGRVLAAAGTTTSDFDPDLVDVSFNGVLLCAGGVEVGDRVAGAEALKPREVIIAVDLHAGEASATILTSDLTADYVHENSAYST